MIEAVLAFALASIGIRVSRPGEPEPLTSARSLIHTIIVVERTLLTVGVGALLPTALFPWMSAAWFTLLAMLYAGHAFAVRHWGSPMSREALLFALRNLRRFASMHPRRVMVAMVALIPVAALGWAAATLDAFLLSRVWRFLLGAGGVTLCVRLCGHIVRRAKFPIETELLLGVIRGGHGPQSAAPPHDPALGARRLADRNLRPQRRPTILVFVLDSARARNMSACGYPRPTTPFLDSLIDRGARTVPYAVANGAMSETGLWSILSSRRVRHHAVNGPRLHDILGAAGFTCRALLSGLHSHSMGLEELYGPDLDQFEDQMIDEELLNCVRRVPARQSSNGDFFFFHIMSPHTASGLEAPVVWTPSRHRFSRNAGGTVGDDERQPFINHYDNSILQADGYVEQIVGILRDKGYLDDAIVVVTADHGEHVFERTPALVSHGHSLYEDSIRIPLLVWDTTRPTPETASFADQTDIAPSILDMVGLESPAIWQGTSIFRQPPRRTTHVEHVEQTVGTAPVHMEALIARLPTGMYKSIRHRRRGVEVRSETYCLTGDPAEQHDLTGTLAPEVGDALERSLEEFRAVPALVPSTTWRFLENG